MERNIILFQPWALVKFQVLNVFNYLKSEEKNYINRWSDENVKAATSSH